VDRMNNDDFYIPLAYQRQFVWSDEDSSYFIESILIGLPIPFMFFADSEDGRTEIVDGAQRVLSILHFVNDELKLEGLKILTLLNGKLFSQLHKETQRRFINSSFRVVYLEEGTTIEVRQEIFNRINSSGIRLKPVEIRRGSIDGPFSQLVTDLAENPLFKELAPLSDSAKKHYDDL